MVRTPSTTCMDVFKGQITVGAKRQYDSNEHGDRKQNDAGSKQSKTMEDTLQTTLPTVKVDASHKMS